MKLKLVGQINLRAYNEGAVAIKYDIRRIRRATSYGRRAQTAARRFRSCRSGSEPGRHYHSQGGHPRDESPGVGHDNAQRGPTCFAQTLWPSHMPGIVGGLQ